MTDISALVGWMARIGDGDRDALKSLYDATSAKLFGIILRIVIDRSEAEDVLQEVFITVWRKAAEYDPARASPITWLATIARNRAIDRLRALGRRPNALPLSAMVDDGDSDDRGMDRALAKGEIVGGGMTDTDPVVVADRAALRAEIQGALDAIPDVERQVLELAYYHDLTQTEIAVRLGWPLGTVKTSTRRALLRLRAALVSSLGPEVALSPDQLVELEASVTDGEAADVAR